MAVITLEGGVKVRTFRPPSGFDPLCASSAELERYGFPARPDDPHLLERYQRVFKRLKGKFQYIEPTFKIDRNLSPGLRNWTSSTLTSFKWSGGIVNAPAGQSFRWLQADFVIPNVYPPQSGIEYKCGVWIGLDGFGVSNDRVCQAGVGYTVYMVGSSIHREIFPWVEWYPDNRIPVTNLTISPGDFMTMLLCTPSGAGSTSAQAYFANTTSGQSTSMEFYPPTHSTISLIGNCAEWIVEAPNNLPGVLNTLPDYGEVFFSSCEAYTAGTAKTSGTLVDGGTGDNLNIVFPYDPMDPTRGKVISQGTLITPTIIQCLYVGA
jgi:hypothetical protein